MTPKTPSDPPAVEMETPGNARLRRLRARLASASTILRAPRVEIRLFGDAHARRIHGAFTARHRRLRFTNAKRWGVALIPLPETFDQYISGSPRKLLRQKRRLAEKAGFRHEVVKAADHLDEILEVNRSAPLRQGGSLPAYYLDPAEIAAIYADRPEIHAILDRSGRLRAYAWAPDAGELVLIETLMGHRDDLEVGIMYLLISEIIRSAIERQAERGLPRWAMYDTFWGASTGLAYFKSRLGFKPFTVRWVWSGPTTPDPRSNRPADSQPTT